MARGKQKDKIAILERQILALDLRKQGLSYRKIAQRLDCDHTVIYDDIQRELKRLADESLDSTAEMRQLDLERIDMAIAGLMPFVQSGSAVHTMALMKSIDERAKLLGLYAPEKQEMVIHDRLSDDERAARIAAILERGRARRDGRTSSTDTLIQ